MLCRDSTPFTVMKIRQAGYIEESFKKKGLSDQAAELIAWATVEKEGGKRKKSPFFRFFIDWIGASIGTFG